MSPQQSQDLRLEAMTAEQRRRLRSAIEAAFKYQELEPVVRDALGRRLDAIVAPQSPLETVVHDLTERADRDGRLAELVRAVWEAKPRHPQVEAIAADLLPADPRPVLAGAAPTPARRPDAPYQSGYLPPHYVPRPDEEQTLQQSLLAEDAAPGVVVSAVFGQGGIGKSTLAAAVVQKPQVRDRFPDGILWATLGQQPEAQGLLMAWVRALGDHQFQAVDAAGAREHLRVLLREREVLLVIDDAWSTEAASEFWVGGPRCRTLITTREAGIAKDLGAQLLPIDVMTPAQALVLLVKRLGRVLRADEQPLARDLVEVVGRLPLAVELVASQAADGIPLAELLADLRQEVARLKSLDRPDVDEAASEVVRKKRSLRASVGLSLARLKPQRRERFAWLGVTPEDAVLNPRMAAALWGVDEREARDELRLLRDKSLLLAAPPVRLGGEDLLAFRLHDVLHDAARNLLTGPRRPAEEGGLPGLGLPLPEAHRVLLGRYRGRTENGRWHTLAADGYIHSRLGWHLEQSEDVAGLHELLLEETSQARNGWDEANERLGQSVNFAEDVARARQAADAAVLQGQPAVGLQCRYALVTASLNSLAGNLPAELLVAVVREGLWPVEQALTHARRTPDPNRKSEAVGRTRRLSGRTAPWAAAGGGPAGCPRRWGWPGMGQL